MNLFSGKKNYDFKLDKKRRWKALKKSRYMQQWNVKFFDYENDEKNS